jgi:hypothetical protein
MVAVRFKFEMTSQQDERYRDSPKAPKRLVPTGSVDEVLFTGSTGGKSLTLLQAVGLMITGLGVALGVGAVLIAGELHLESTFDRDYGQLFAGGAFLLWGIAMLVFGFVGVVKIIRKRKQI